VDKLAAPRFCTAKTDAKVYLLHSVWPSVRSQHHLVIPVCYPYHPAQVLIDKHSDIFDNGVVYGKLLRQFGDAFVNADGHDSNHDDRKDQSGGAR
jgi:hypothetical protein